VIPVIEFFFNLNPLNVIQVSARIPSTGFES